MVTTPVSRTRNSIHKSMEYLPYITPPCISLLNVRRRVLHVVTSGRAIKARRCGDIGAAYLYATTPFMFTGASETSFNRVRDAVRTIQWLYGANTSFSQCLDAPD